MKLSKLREEVKLTLNLMQQDIDDCAHSELQMHLRGLLLLKREVLQQAGEEYAEDVPMHSVVMTLSSLAPARESEQIEVGEALFRTQFEPKRSEEIALTAEELKAGGWWCADTGDGSLKAFLSLGFKTEGNIPWDGFYYACFLYTHGSNLLDRGSEDHTDGLKQIHRIGNEFYWCEK